VPYTAETLTSSIVVLGDFNPAIFSPEWLTRNKLIGEADAKLAIEGSQGRKSLVSHQVSNFESDWFTLQVLQNQFSLTSRGVLTPALKDLAVGIFQLVSHTPVNAVGLNFMGNFKLASQAQYHEVGDMFAPKDIWNKIFPDRSTGLAMLTILIQKGTRDDIVASKDSQRISIEPSSNFKYGITLSFNDHHDVTESDDKDLSPAERVAAIVDKQWEPLWGETVRVFDQVLSSAITT